MKKGLLILLCGCLLFGLCACTGQNGTKSKETTTVTTTTSTTKKRKTDFRNVCWGDSAAKVKKEEKAELITRTIICSCILRLSILRKCICFITLTVMISFT